MQFTAKTHRCLNEKFHTDLHIRVDVLTYRRSRDYQNFSHLQVTTGAFFLHEHAHYDLIKSTLLVTATMVHSHRDKILHFESLLEIQIVADT